MLFKWRYRLLWIALLAGYSYLNILYTIGDALIDIAVPDWCLPIMVLLVVTGIWETNRATVNLVIRPGVSARLNPLIALFLISLLHVLWVTGGVGLLFYLSFPDAASSNLSQIKLLVAFGFRINLFLHCINGIVYYMNRYRQTQLEAEQLKKVSIEARFEALRNQINPHFLFNCFNALSSLVYKDADTSARFISQLATVYRYLLYNQEKNLVPLAEELAFLDSYFYLLKIRFGDNIIIVNEIEADAETHVPPAVLQMLVENVIKHNIISRKQPLQVKLTRGGDFVLVINSLQPKSTPETSTKVGLKNISQRYRLLCDQPVEVKSGDGLFVVRVPLLKLSDYEGAYR